MMKHVSILIAVACSVFALQPAEKKLTPLAAMVEQERAFAKTAADKTVRDAFLEFLADESLLFSPGPVPGKMFYRNRPALPIKLSWAPELADVSAAGDLGYTSGPYEIRKTAADPPASYGHFNTLWRLQKDGSWKVEVDLGVPHEKPAVSVADVKTVESPKDNAPAPKETKPVLEWQKELEEADKAFNARATAVGVAKAYQESAADSIRLMRSDNLPALGKEAAVKLVEKSHTRSWQPALARMSSSGDLGYSTGRMIMDASSNAPAAGPPPPPTPGSGVAPGQSAPGAPGAAAGNAPPPVPATPHYYVRIWRRDKVGAWKIVLEVAP
jgi:ketosteroid isomerase-like protein